MRSKLGRFTDKVRGFSVEHIPPYTELADIYDRIMIHVDYVSWTRYISSIFQHVNIGVNNILEIACGTGNLSIDLHKLGYTVTATDLSLPMLAKARQKCKKSGIQIKLFASSMTSIPLRSQFDAVLCIYDSINYMTTPDDFIQVLNEVSSVTRKGGLFVFDVCTRKNSEMFFSNKTMGETFHDMSYERVCSFTPSDRIQKNHFIIHKNGKQYSENHYQKIYSLAEISEMISHTPFREHGRYDDLSFMLGTENSERVHFVLQKT